MKAGPYPPGVSCALKLSTLKTAEVKANLRGLLGLDSGADKIPSFLTVLCWSGQLETVHVNNEEQPQLWTSDARRPIWHKLVGYGLQTSEAMLLPLAATVGVPV